MPAFQDSASCVWLEMQGEYCLSADPDCHTSRFSVWLDSPGIKVLIETR